MISQNTARGLLLLGISLFFLLQAPGYSIGTLTRPGPGLFPVMVAGLLLVVSIIILARSRFIEAIPLEFSFRNIALIAASLIAFALVSQYVNMLAAIVVMTTMASFASEDFSVMRTAIIAAGLCAIAYAMKTYLGVNLPLWR